MLILFKTKAQGSMFVEVRPTALKESLDKYREMIGGGDTVLFDKPQEYVEIQYTKNKKKETIDYLYNGNQLYFWEGRKRRGWVQYNTTLRIRYVLNLNGVVRKIIVYIGGENKKVVVKKYFGIAIVTKYSKNYHPSEREEFKNMLINFNKDLPI